MKTLDDAIGCWTTNPDGLISRLAGVRQSVLLCRTITRRNKHRDDEKLLAELQLLRRRIEALDEIAASAENRIKEIIFSRECRP